MRLSTRLAAAFGFLALAGCAALSEGRNKGDVFAIGTLEEQTYTSMSLPQQSLEYGIFTAQFRVTKIIRGRLPTATVTVSYFGMTPFAENYEHRFRLRPHGDGTGYMIGAEPGRSGVRCYESAVLNAQP